MTETTTDTQRLNIPAAPTYESPTFERVLAHASQGVLFGLGVTIVMTVIVAPLAFITSLPWQWLAYVILGAGAIACGGVWMVKVASPRYILNTMYEDLSAHASRLYTDNVRLTQADRLREDAYQRLLADRNSLDYQLRQAQRTKNTTLREDLYDTPVRRDARRMQQLYYQQEGTRRAPSREFMRQHEHNWTDKRHAEAYQLLRDCGWLVATNKGNPQFPYQEPQEGYALLASFLKEPDSEPDSGPQGL